MSEPVKPAAEGIEPEDDKREQDEPEERLVLPAKLEADNAESESNPNENDDNAAEREAAVAEETTKVEGQISPKGVEGQISPKGVEGQISPKGVEAHKKNESGAEGVQDEEGEEEVADDDDNDEDDDDDEEDEKRDLAAKDSEASMKLPSNNFSIKRTEDEEMLSMTISAPSKIDESQNNIESEEKLRNDDVESNSAKSVTKQEEDNDSDSDSVCVIDDDDDEDEENGEDDGFLYNEDETSSLYPDNDSDSEETDRDQYSDSHDRKTVRRVKDDDDEEEEEDEEEDEEVEEVEEYDSEVDGFDGGSDDLVLRHSNGLIKHHKERSASLQDLNLIKGNMQKNKCNVNSSNDKTKFSRNQSKERRMSGKQYSHVESKVKKYIMDMTQQRKISGEQRKKAQEEAKHKNKEQTGAQIRRNDDIALTCKTIKNYAEKTLKEVAKFEEIDNDEMYVMPLAVENGEMHMFHRHPMDMSQPMHGSNEMEVDPIDIGSPNKEDKLNKVNGSVGNENENYILEKKGIHRCEDDPLKPILNGEGPLNSMPNLRALSYNEYMKGAISEEVQEEIIHDEGIAEVMPERNVCEKPSNKNDNGSAPCILRIENVTSCYSNDEKMQPLVYHNLKAPQQASTVNQSTETHYEEKVEIRALKAQLVRKNSQMDNLRDAFQKTMAENMSMKVEMDNLRKMLSYYQEMRPVAETKVAAVQTEHQQQQQHQQQVPSTSKGPAAEQKSYNPNADPRLITNSMISTISSQWSDSTESATVSMEPPPNVTNAINSDESMQQPSGKPTTSTKQKNAFSRAFVTSSKILQTLSSITHGRSKSDRYGSYRGSSLSKGGSNESHVEAASAVPGTGERSKLVEPGSRKRKATDSAEFSNSGRPFKIPHTSKTSSWEAEKRKTNSPDIEYVNEDEDEDEDEDVDDNDNTNNVEAEDKAESDEVEDTDDDVKIFVYPEDDESKEHSFLIQAKEMSNNPSSGVRECGPYLLGNIEVYMTEMNGTINIWGKELSKSNEELESSTRSKDLRPNFRWQSTPRIFNQQPGTTSGSRRSRVQPRFTDQQKEHSCKANNSAIAGGGRECESCGSHSHRLPWPLSCQNHQNNAAQYDGQRGGCCSPTERLVETRCGCGRRVERRSLGASSCCNSPKYADSRSYSSSGCHETGNIIRCCCNSRHSQCRGPVQEQSCRHQPPVRRHSFNPAEDDDYEANVTENLHGNGSKTCHSASFQNNSPHSFAEAAAKATSPCLNNAKCNGLGCSEGPVCQNEHDPLILQRQNPEAPEVRKRRSSGKKVRGLLMDLLKGCGDCRTAAPINKPNVHNNNTSVYEPSTSVQSKIACSPNQQSCSLRSNEKCSSCRNRNDKTAEIETQLEFFRIEMEKLRCRSDTLKEMLDTLRNTEATN